MRRQYQVAQDNVEAHDLSGGQRRRLDPEFSHRTFGPRWFRFAAVPLAMIAWTLAGCASQPAGDPTLLEFLEAGNTTRDQVVARLGAPTSQFERGRIVVYPLDSRRAGYTLGWPVTGGWAERSRPVGRFHLIIEFDEHGVLQQHVVVDVGASPAT